MAKAANSKIEVPQLKISTFRIKLKGKTPLIMHKFSEKSKKEMRDKQTKQATKGREAKNPEADYKASMYDHPDGGHGFPSIAFKAAAVRAGKMVGMVMTDTKQCFHIDGDLVKINGEPRMREDIVRLQGSTADLRYRGEFVDWSTEFDIKYRSDIISKEQLVNLFQHAGFSVGVGEWRVEKNGSNGQFEVEA
jgi:hypothetical protein